MNDELQSKFYKSIEELGIIRRTGNFKKYLQYIFADIDFKDKNVLDVGAGLGLYSFAMGIAGAKKVIGLEPESAGSRNGYIEKFNKLKTGLGLDTVQIIDKTFQQFESQGEKFNVVLLHNSINHLDEPSCIQLTKSSEAQEEYKKIFQKIFDLCDQNCQLVIADCSNRNLFADLKMKNPFSPTIEWHKHQAPESWIKILSEIGFKNPKIKWVYPSQFGKLGGIFFNNKMASYFWNSHFIIYMKK